MSLVIIHGKRIQAGKQVANLQDKLDDLKDSSVSLKGTGVERLNNSVNLLSEGFQNFDVDKLKIGFDAIGSAMKAIPIFLIIEGLRLLAENFEDVTQFAKKFFNLQSEGEKEIIKLNKQIKEQENITKSLGGNLEREIDLMEAQGVGVEKIIAKKKELAKVQLKELELQGQLSVAKIRDIAQTDTMIEGTQRLQASISRKLGDTATAELLEKAISQSKKERMAEELKVFNETNEKIKNIGNSLKVEEAKAETKAKDESIKNAKETQSELEALLKEAIDAENKLKQDDRDENQFLVKNNILTSNKEREELELNGEQKILEMKFNANDIYRQRELEAIREFNDKERDLAIQKYNAIGTIAQTSANALNGLSDIIFQTQLNNVKKGSEEEEKLKRKQFELNKKMQIGQAIINGAQGLLNAVTQPSGVPIPFDIPLRVAKSVAVVATTGATIAKIAGTQFGSGGSNAGSGGSNVVPAVSGNAPQFNSIAPNINPASTQPFTRLDEQGKPININTQIKVKADVLETDISDKQKERERRKNATQF